MAKVFVVEDDEALRRMLVTILRRGGHEVLLQAGNMRRALEEADGIERLGISVAVIDGAFPSEGDGASLATILKKRVPSIKIVSLAGAMQSWGDGNLQKPEGVLILCTTIQEVLES